MIKIVPFSRGYLITILRAFDLFLGTLIWRDYDITISSQTGLAMRKTNPPRWAKILNWFLNKIETNHCELAIVADIERAKNSLAILEGKVKS